jgi:hypothetical protein
MKGFAYNIGFVLILFACDKPISDFQANNFIKYIGNGSSSMGYDALELNDGGYIVTGYDNSIQFRKQILVARTDKNGNTIWKKFFGTEHNEEGRIVKLFNGEILISGNKTDYIYSKTETFLMRVSMQGDSIATYLYSSTNNNVVINYMDISNNLIYIAGEQNDGTAASAKYYFACIDQDGNIVRERAFPGSGSFGKFFVKESGNILAVGTAISTSGSVTSRISVQELSPNFVPVGGINFTTTINQTFCNALYQNNNLFVFYSTNTISSICSMTQNNAIDWVSSTTIPGLGTSMVLKDDNTFLLASSSSNQVKFYTFQFSEGGNADITELRNFPGDVKAIIKTNDKGFLATGSNSSDYGGMVRLIKTDKDLFLLNE